MSLPRANENSGHQFSALTGAAAAPGRVVWHDLMTTDVARSVDYYTKLFGWTMRAANMGPMGTYTRISSNGRDIGGMVSFDASHALPSHWVAYISTPSVDAVCDATPSVGGKTCVPPTDIPTIGRFAVVEDPAGAIFSPFSYVGAAAPEIDGPPAAGAFCFDELLTTKPAECAEFYANLFGWTTATYDMGPAGTYWMFKRGAIDAAGMMQMPTDAMGRPSWLPYVAVADVDASAQLATTLGGTIYVPPRDIPAVGRFAVTADATGAMIALFRGA